MCLSSGGNEPAGSLTGELRGPEAGHQLAGSRGVAPEAKIVVTPSDPGAEPTPQTDSGCAFASC